MNGAKIARQLWAQLWEDYRQRVSYARIYEEMIREALGTVANDHIAWRSLRLSVNGVNLGIPYIAEMAEALGYEMAGEYEFRDRHLYARHYRHPEAETGDLPKLFISELVVEELPAEIAEAIVETVKTARFDRPNIEQILKTTSETEISSLLSSLFRSNPNNTLSSSPLPITASPRHRVHPWQPPKKSILEAINAVSQYGAWVLLHGYAVNHFTGYVNRQNTSQYPDIESTAKGLAARGVPMKEEIEGDAGTGLQQTATQAVVENVTVLDDRTGEPIQIPWTYAYYEIAQRHLVEVAPGRRELFDGFLGNQARHLFEMTRV